ncbi:hypothetical protein [Methanolapillus ohkumae]|uniref:hypothetical protein n=1 Tax=Methanolapillus ohkumae TaxID=3028298 RepID=UPI0030B86C7E
MSVPLIYEVKYFIFFVFIFKQQDYCFSETNIFFKNKYTFVKIQTIKMYAKPAMNKIKAASVSYPKVPEKLKFSEKKELKIEMGI